MRFHKAKKLIAICLTSIMILGFGFGFGAQNVLADWTTGKFDAAMDFNGTGDFIFAGDLNENVKTVSFWIKADFIADEKIIDLDAGMHYIQVDTGALSAPGFAATPIYYIDGTATLTPTLDTNWHFVAITTDTAIDANAVYLGKVFIDPTEHFFDGVLDDIKFYDRVLTALEVAEHYRQRSPSIAQGGTISASSTSTLLEITQSGTGNIADFKSGASSILTVQDADRLKMRDATLFTFGDINEGIIDDMESAEAVTEWVESNDGVTDVATESTIVKVNDGSMKITTTASSSNTDTLTKTISETAFNVNDRIGFWIRATETGQIISLEFNDDGGTDPHHNITIDAANRWQYEEWDISSYDAEIDVVTGIIFIVDDDTGSPTIYIDQLRYYDKDNRSGEIFVDGDGHLVLAGEQGIELQANITSSLPGLAIGAAIVEVNQPFAVNVAGDTGINYDLAFLNTGSTFVTSEGPLTIAAGDPNHSENLTISTQSNLAGGDSGRITAVSVTSMTDDTKTWTTDQWKDGTVSIVSGTGASQTQVITSSTSGEVINVADWDTTLGDPIVGSYYTVNYARGGDVLVNISQTHLQIGGFKILGADSSSYVFKVSADGDVEIGGAGLGGSDLLVKQNISLTGGNITVGQLNISDAGTLGATIDYSTDGACTSAASPDYYYVIVAVNDNGTTAYAGEVLVNHATGIDNEAQITWDPVAGATGYKLYRNTDNDWTDGDDHWVDGKVISALETIYVDDCTGDTASQTPPTENTTGGDLIVTGDFKKTCADGYIWVPGSAKYGTMPGFCVMKYEARCITGFGADSYTTGDCDNYTSIPYATDASISSLPWNVVSQEEARAKCAAIGTDYHLMSDAEWMTIAANIADTTINDMGSAGGLQLAGGHNDANDFADGSNGVANLAAADPDVSECDLTKTMEHADNAYVADDCEIRGTGADGSAHADEKGFYDTGDVWATAYVAGGETKSQLRTHILSNGEVIWDIAGNYWEWTDKMIYEDETDGGADGDDTYGCTAEMPDTSEKESYVYKSTIAIEDPTAADDSFFEELADPVTFTSIYCKTLVGTATLDVQIAGADINGADIVCDTTGVLDSSLGGDTSGAVGQELKLAITSVADVPTYLMVQINGISVSGETAKGWEEYTSIVDFKGLSIRPTDDGWIAANGIGKIYITPGHAYSGAYDSSYHAFIRGGHWADTSDAGVFALRLHTSPARSTNPAIGFRCSR